MQAGADMWRVRVKMQLHAQARTPVLMRPLARQSQQSTERSKWAASQLARHDGAVALPTAAMENDMWSTLSTSNDIRVVDMQKLRFRIIVSHCTH